MINCNIDEIEGLIYKICNKYQEKRDDNDFIEDVACIYNDDIGDSVWNTEGHVVKVTGGIKYDFSNFDWYYDVVDWDILPIIGGGTTIITSTS